MKNFALTLSTLLLLCGAARAEDPLPLAVIPPPSVEGSLRGPEVDLFLAALDAAFADAGWKVLPAEQTSELPVSSSGACEDARCALEYARAANAEHALQLSLFLAPDQTIRFTLTLVQAPDHAFVYSADDVNPLQSGPAFSLAAAELTRQYRRGPGPWLEVRGEPVDATVFLDGSAVGALPLTQPISEGEHTLTVRAEGYADFDAILSVDGPAGHVETVEVDLEPTTPAAVAKAPPPKRMRAVDWAGVGTLAAAGTASLVGGLAIRDAACISRYEGQCAEWRPKWGAPAKALVGVGAALLAGSVGWGLWRSFAPYADRHSAGLTYRKDF